MCRASLTLILTRHSFSVQWFSVRDPPTLHYKDPPGRQLELFPRFLKFLGERAVLVFHISVFASQELPEMFGMSECHICFCTNVASSWEGRDSLSWVKGFGTLSSP